MIIEPSGVVMMGHCTVQTDKCTAKEGSAITAVWATPGRNQIDVCRECLEEKIRIGDWEVEGARVTNHPTV